MVTIPRDRLKFIAIAGIVVLFLTIAGFSRVAAEIYGTYRELCDTQFLAYNDLNITESVTKYCVGESERTKFVEPDIVFEIRHYNAIVYDSEVAARKVLEGEVSAAARGDSSPFFSGLTDNETAIFERASILAPDDALVRSTTRTISFVPEVYAANRTDPDGPYYLEDWESTLFEQQYADLVVQAGRCVFNVVAGKNDSPKNVAEYHGYEQYQDANGTWRERAINKHSASEHNRSAELAEFVEDTTRGNLLPYLAEVLPECEAEISAQPTGTSEKPGELTLAELWERGRHLYTKWFDEVSPPQIKNPAVVGDENFYACSNYCTFQYGPTLGNICRANKTELLKFDSFHLCEIEAYNRTIHSCHEAICGAYFYSGDRGPSILPSSIIEETIKIPLSELTERRPKIINSGTNEIEKSIKLSLEQSEAYTRNVIESIDKSGVVSFSSDGVLSVDTNAEARFTTPQETIIHVEPRTSIEFNLRSASAEQLRLLRGDVEIKTSNGRKIRVDVPQGEITNDGTHFWVRVTEDGNTIVGVYEGAVRLKSLITEAEEVITPVNENPGIAGLRFLSFEELGMPGSEKRNGVWMWVLAVVIISAVGYLMYHNREKIGALLSQKSKVR